MNERGEVMVACSSPHFRWCVWVNITRNPRLKTLEMPEIQVSMDISKQLALTGIAIRVQVSPLHSAVPLQVECQLSP